MNSLKSILLLSTAGALSACPSGNAGKQATPSQQAVINRAASLRSANPTLTEQEAIREAAVEAIFSPGLWTKGDAIQAKREQDKLKDQLAKNARK